MWMLFLGKFKTLVFSFRNWRFSEMEKVEYLTAFYRKYYNPFTERTGNQGFRDMSYKEDT